MVEPPCGGCHACSAGMLNRQVVLGMDGCGEGTGTLVGSRAGQRWQVVGQEPDDPPVRLAQQPLTVPPARLGRPPRGSSRCGYLLRPGVAHHDRPWAASRLKQVRGPCTGIVTLPQVSGRASGRAPTPPPGCSEQQAVPTTHYPEHAYSAGMAPHPTATQPRHPPKPRSDLPLSSLVCSYASSSVRKMASSGRSIAEMIFSATLSRSFWPQNGSDTS